MWKRIRSVLKWGSIGIILLIIIWCLFNRDFVTYGLGQARGQWRVMTQTVPVTTMLEDKLVSDSVKSRLRWIREIKAFAIDSLGLNSSGSYEEVYDTGGDPVLWMVQACPRFALEPYQWDYPFLGELDYRGFFEYGKAEALSKELSNKGFDVHIGEVSAWSTLGWLDDPVLSSMFSLDEGRLARLIIHELTHGTMYVSGETTFNENLATFVGDQGAVHYLKSKYGRDSLQLQSYLGFLSDLDKFTELMLLATDSLSKLYMSAAFLQQPLEQQSLVKRQTIEFWVGENALRDYHHQGFSRWGHKELPNNARFLGYLTYRKDQTEFVERFRNDFQGDFKAYLSQLKVEYGH